MHDTDAPLETALHCGDQHRRTALKAAMVLLWGAGALTASPAHADPEDDGFRIGGQPGRGWRMIGEKQARRSVDRDEMRVRADRAYSAMRLRVFRAPIEFFRVQVHFRNGGSREIEVRQIIERGGATRIIDLPGEKRFIEKIVFWYKTPALARERATVQVWARG
jgi:hypothetical protein